MTHGLDFGTMLALSGANGPLVLSVLRTYTAEIGQGALVVAGQRRERVGCVPVGECIPVLTCQLHHRLLVQGEHLTHRCQGWTDDMTRQLDWCPEVA